MVLVWLHLFHICSEFAKQGIEHQSINASEQEKGKNPYNFPYLHLYKDRIVTRQHQKQTKV